MFPLRHFIKDFAPVGQHTWRSAPIAPARVAQMSLLQFANKITACLQQRSNQFIKIFHYASSAGSRVISGCFEEACSASDKEDVLDRSACVEYFIPDPAFPHPNNNKALPNPLLASLVPPERQNSDLLERKTRTPTLCLTHCFSLAPPPLSVVDLNSGGYLRHSTGSFK